ASNHQQRPAGVGRRVGGRHYADLRDGERRRGDPRRTLALDRQPALPNRGHRVPLPQPPPPRRPGLTTGLRREPAHHSRGRRGVGM
ncbi:MAG: hypothetical protein AVDCRST_MAG83-1677, partial [uncultured Arthrobacter sp.]